MMFQALVGRLLKFNPPAGILLIFSGCTQAGNRLLSCFPVQDGMFFVILRGELPLRAGSGADPGLALLVLYAFRMHNPFWSCPRAYGSFRAAPLTFA